LHEDQYTFLIISRSNFFRMRNISDKLCGENQNTHFRFSNFFFSRKSYLYEIIWKNIVEPGKQQMTIWRMRTAFWIPKATNTHSEYVTRISFPLQPWFHEGSCLVTTCRIYFISFPYVLYCSSASLSCYFLYDVNTGHERSSPHTRTYEIRATWRVETALGFPSHG
jgi:hypothetical protein